MTKLLIGVLSLALVGTGGLVAAVDGFDTEQVRGVSVPAATTDRDTTTDGETTTGRTTTLGGEDISGPCDEAEHRDDPRCAGTATATGDDGDNSGPGGGSDHDSDDDDRSGSNSGRG